MINGNGNFWARTMVDIFPYGPMPSRQLLWSAITLSEGTDGSKDKSMRDGVFVPHFSWRVSVERVPD